MKKPYCRDGTSLRTTHYFEVLDGRILEKCAFCRFPNPEFKIRQICIDHFSIFNIFNLLCSTECNEESMSQASIESDKLQHEYNMKQGYSICYCSACEAIHKKTKKAQQAAAKHCENCSILLKVKCNHNQDKKG
jgi:hypothetical protein